MFKYCRNGCQPYKKHHYVYFSYIYIHIYLYTSRGDQANREETYADGFISAQVEQGVQEHGSMSSRENESVTVEPERVRGIVVHELSPEQVGHGSTSHWHAWMSWVCLVDGINGKEADCVDSNVHVFLADLQQSWYWFISRFFTRILEVQLGVTNYLPEWLSQNFCLYRWLLPIEILPDLR